MSPDLKGGGQGDPDASETSPADSRPIYNWLSVFGGMLGVGSLTAGVFFLLVDLVSNGGAGYSGVALLPVAGLALLGAAMMLVGYVRERWRNKRGRQSSFHHKWVIEPDRLIRGVSPFVIGTGIVISTLVVLGGGAGSLMLVSYTESNAFCGEVCHSVMTPEATVHAASPHSQIACVECHVGSGGASYVNAKLSGLRQVYQMATGDIRRPIPTPIHNRRSSSEMCETCHTVDRMDEYKAASRSYFLSGDENEEVKLHMMMKIGSGLAGPMQGAGIHYHMQVAQKVEFIARDPQRQDIAWVRVTDRNGGEREYSNDDDPLTDTERENLEVLTMECLDCHSRPAHRFPSPVESINAALTTGHVSPKIPYIKEAAVAVLDGDYSTTEEALGSMRERLRDYYEEEYPDELGEYSNELDETVHALRSIYRSTIFPGMKADWTAHPNNAGHRVTPGCFRCHNEAMIDDGGEAIFTDCNRCHAILSQGDSVVDATNFEEGSAFVHPDDWETIEEFTLCSDCHDGGAGAYE